MLYVPGCNRRYLEKAKSLNVDSVILDLGDPILIDAKEMSRDNVVDFLNQDCYGKREVVVRVNDFDSPWGLDDIKAVAHLNPDAIESPIAVLHAEEIASASDRIQCMILATSDLISQLHARSTQSRVAILHSLSTVILAARAYGHAVVDGIHSNLKDTESFEYACRMGRDMGFDGKSLVHPDQLPYANDAYTPKAEEIEHAQAVITALAEANESGRGTVVVNDRLVEHHHVRAAERLLRLNELIMELNHD